VAVDLESRRMRRSYSAAEEASTTGLIPAYRGRTGL
jgi:hypothetical protein